MREIEDRCVGCPTCVGSTCKNVNVPVYYCDECGEELDPDEIYRVGSEDLCEDCLKDMFKYDVSYDE